ncbi:MAG: hypothetical protein BECKG1743D_GA0114223_100354 [Candidatus Kentron sp. G]|nr:MAG: hypothetical protein BECKG1743F_GA0114225_100295 [Candidatus Kentron sp. G]VFM97902.1 MAG: hypothetical protein BECKG1743D_GA0114223_100354 [Candidatus Kentron sp. G]
MGSPIGSDWFSAAYPGIVRACNAEVVCKHTHEAASKNNLVGLYAKVIQHHYQRMFRRKFKILPLKVYFMEYIRLLHLYF